MEKTITLTKDEARRAFRVMFMFADMDVLNVDEWEVLYKLASEVDKDDDILEIIKEEMAVAIAAEKAADAE